MQFILCVVKCEVIQGGVLREISIRDRQRCAVVMGKALRGVGGDHGYGTRSYHPMLIDLSTTTPLHEVDKVRDIRALFSIPKA